MSPESSRSMRKNYAAHDLELAAIVHALKMWRHYLMGRKFELRTDHHGLKYLFDQPNLNARQARWLELISEFDSDIVHVKGEENRVVEALSRRLQATYVAVASSYRIRPCCLEEGNGIQAEVSLVCNCRCSCRCRYRYKCGYMSSHM